MNTRSKYARLGLEMMQSSWFAAPSFGADEPTPIVFEMQAHRRIEGFSEDEPYAFVMLFALEKPLRLDGRAYNTRFPFHAGMEGPVPRMKASAESDSIASPSDDAGKPAIRTPHRGR
ncbi:MAG TPA: hypothetical protein VGG48_11450 [Rhizomicrobium sp.]|jgi:hypothetical protein